MSDDGENKVIKKKIKTTFRDINTSQFRNNDLLPLKQKMDCSKTCVKVKRPLSKRPKIVFQDQLSLNAGQKYCRMLQGKHSAVLLTFIKLPFVIKIFVLTILSGCFTQVFILYINVDGKTHHIEQD